MTDFEDQLRRALERQEPSQDFAARVMSQVSAKPRPRAIFNWFQWPAWTAAAIAASLLLASTGLDLERRQRLARQQGQAARAQLIQAMEITSAQLNKIHKKVQGAVR